MEKQLAALLESIMHISVKAERKKKGQAVPCQLHANKLRIMWVGQYRVMASTDYYFTAEYLVNGGIMNVHPLRIKFYARLKIRRSYSTTSLSRDV
ncbi:hypothetical protein PPTG_23425 [Phytophthora nicotianae INRA-310]|uniref:Uncharacterized protein n=1 Tax=Phytophthora nicotianae (strain INRA-310) TaxID=761204 RepID=W2PXX0_PHYN3|nr:hypothetical protein PPTG_23425 [Phytophthora nicotianae INRA-310]ETN05742.1 hypothetical protein PPTG_23425 [Phytophthora nicotianae INRA-310]